MIIRTTFSFYAIIVALIGSTGSAFGTPPLIAQIKDRPLAVSGSHIYMQRSIKDNRGSYGRTYSEVFLLKIDLQTRDVDETRLMYSASSDFEDEAAFKSTSPTDFNLFQYLEKEKAAILIEEAAPSDYISIMRGTGGHLLTQISETKVDDKTVLSASSATLINAELLDKVNASIEPTMDAYIGPIPVPTPNVELYTLSTTFSQPCRLSKLTPISGPFIHPDIYLVYLDCPSRDDNEEDLYGHIVLPVKLKFTTTKPVAGQ